MNRCYIFHCIGTLTMEHVRRSLASLEAQEPFHWERFVLYNGGDFTNDELLALVPEGRFDRIEVFPYDPRTPKSAVADWDIQMRLIDGSERYLVHKADFYLPPWTCATLDGIQGGNWFALFNKYDMKERATLEDIQRYATLPWREGVALETTGTYGSHLGKLAIPWHQEQGPDGTMHAYSDDVRHHFQPSQDERAARWGAAGCMVALSCKVPFLRDDRLFGVHMYHPSPDRLDPEKNREGERF